MNIEIKPSFKIELLELKLRRLGLLLVIFILSIPLNLYSQVLINEYYNTTSNQNEWIELIVTKENANLANFILFDSEISDSSPLQYNGGVEFKNVAFWNNMPKGTFIIIYLKDVDNSLLGIDKVKGRIAVEATDASLFEQKCENCNIGNWNLEAFIIDNDAELFTITHNSNNIHTLGHTSNNIGHFVNNMGILTKTTLNNNEAISVIPGDSQLSYFAGYDELKQNATNNTFKTVGGSNRLSSGTPLNHTFIDLLRAPQWLNPGPLNIIEVNNQFNLKWGKVSNTPQPDIYYSFLVIITPGNLEEGDLPKNGTNYKIGDAIGKSTVLEIVQGNKDGNVNISTSLKCGTDYTISVILGRFRDLSNNYLFYLSNGITYNTSNYIKNTIRRENVENYNILTDGNETVFCVKQDTTITIKTSITDIQKYKFTWFKGGTMFKIGTQYGQNAELEVNESGNYFVQVSNVDGCIKNSNLLSIQINKSPKVKIYRGEKLISQDTLIEVCKGELIDLKAKTDYGTISWYQLLNNKYSLVKNDWEFDVNGNGQFVAIASEGDCQDTSKIVTVNILDYSFTLDKNLIAFYKLLNIDRTIDVLITNNSDKELIFNEDDVNITPPFKLSNVVFPLIIPAKSSLKIYVLLDSDDFTSEDYFLELNNKCDTKKKTTIKAFRINDQVIIEPREVKFPKKLKCKNIDNDTIINIFNNTEGNISINASVNLPFVINNALPTITAKQDTLKLKLSFNPNINGIYYDTLLVTYISDGVEDYFKIPVQGEIYEPVLEIQPDSIDLGILSYCVNQKDTTIRLTNNFSTDITIETQFNNGMLFKNLPITISKNDYLDVDVSILTPNNGVFNFNSSFESLPCTIDNKINIKGKKSQISYTFDKDIMKYDTIYDCNNIDYLVQTNRLSITSDEALFAGIDSIYVPFGFTTDLKLGQELFNITNFSVTFTPNNQTSYDDYIFIKYAPCGDIDSIRLSGEYRIIEYEIPDTIFYDINLVGTSQTQSVIIKNKSTSKISFTIDDISNSNFTILDKLNKYNLLTYDDELKIDIVYLSNIESQDTSILNVKFDYPCNSEKQIVLISGSKVEIINDVDINFSLEKNIYHDANKELSLDLKVYSNQYDLDTFDIKNVEIEIEVNTFILNLLSITDSKQNPLSVDYQIANNLIKLNFDKLNESIINLKFQPLLGKGIIAPIKIGKFTFDFDENTTINLDSTEVELYGICEIEERMFSLGENTNLIIGQNNFKDATISIITNNKENTLLEIFDYKGSLVNKLCDDILPIGEYTYQINDLETGIYFVRFSNGLNSHQNRFIIVK
jgi:hypothetical protein